MKENNLPIIIVLVLVCILVAIDIALRFWYWNGLELGIDKDNAEIFNNIVTPIGGIVSVVFFAGALFLTIRQTNIQFSQALKPNFENQYNRTKENYVSNANLPGPNQLANIGAMFAFLRHEVLTINADQDYRLDLADYHSNVFRPRDYFINRDYYDRVSNMNTQCIRINLKLDSIVSFIKSINKSKLLEEDKEYFKASIRDELLTEYFTFMAISDQIQLMVPDMLSIGNSIQFKQFQDLFLRKHESILKKELGVNY